MQLTRGVLPLVIGNYAKNFGVTLFMYGHSAYTNGQQITIPRLNLEDSEAMEMAYGYVAHECGHIRYSDWDTIRSLDSTDTLFGLFNSLEDCRIEYLQTLDWPGLDKTFDFLVGALSSDIKKHNLRCQKTNNIDNLLILYCNYFVRVSENKNESASEVLRQLTRILKKMVPESIMLAINELLIGTTLCANSQGVLEKAKAIMSLAQNLMEGFKYKGEQAGNSENSADSAEKEEKEAKALRDTAESTLMEELKKHNFSDSTLKKLIKDFEKLDKKELSYPELSSSFDNSIPNLVDKLCSKSSGVKSSSDFGTTTPGMARPMEGSKLLEKVFVDVQLKNKLSHLVRGYCEWFNGHCSNGRKLDIRKYGLRRCSSSSTFFMQTALRKKLNTNIHLLADISGSMSNYCEDNKCCRYEISNNVALSLALALEGIKNMCCDVTYFPGEQSEFEIVSRQGDNIRHRAPYFDQRPKGCTPLSQALMHAIENFPRIDKLQRNIIIVITDGDPDNPNSAEQIMNKAIAAGIEIYAIRIGSAPRYHDIFQECINIEDAKDLPNTMCNMLQTALFKHKSMPF